MPAVFEASREQSADRERVNAGAKAVGPVLDRRSASSHPRP